MNWINKIRLPAKIKKKAWDNITSDLGNAWNSILTTASNIWNAIVKAIMDPIHALWNWLFGGSIIPDMVAGFESAWNSILNITLGIWKSIKNAMTAPLFGAWDAIYTILNVLTTFLSNSWNSILTTATTVWGKIANAIGNALPTWLLGMISGTYTWTWPALPDWSNAWSELVTTIYNILPDWLKQLLGLAGWSNYSDWSDWSGDTWSGDHSDAWSGNYGDSGWPNTPWSGDNSPYQVYYDSVPYARGGIITKPTKALIGEAGPEAIIPLPGYLKGGGLSDINVTLNIGNVYGIDDLEAAIEQAFEKLKWQIRAAGG